MCSEICKFTHATDSLTLTTSKLTFQLLDALPRRLDFHRYYDQVSDLRYITKGLLSELATFFFKERPTASDCLCLFTFFIRSCIASRVILSLDHSLAS